MNFIRMSFEWIILHDNSKDCSVQRGGVPPITDSFHKS